MKILSILSILILFTGLSVFGQTEPAKLYIRGTGLNRNAARILKIGSSTVYNTASGRGLRLTVINKSDQSVISDLTYDCHGNTASSESLATMLNSMTNEQIGILTSFDAWEYSVTSNLDAAFYRLGLTRAGATVNGVSGISARRPYAAIFEGASNSEPTGKVVEVSFNSTLNMPYAEISGFLIEGSFVATGNQSNALLKPQGDGIGIMVNYDGNVGIGTTSPAEKLSVDGTILAKEVRVSVNASDWPDYVFEKTYNLPDFSGLEAYIKENKHLPDIPGGAEIERQGIDLGEMNKVLLKKVEELTLYAIEKDKQIRELATEGKRQHEESEQTEGALRKRLEVLEDKLAKIETLLVGKKE